MAARSPRPSGQHLERGLTLDRRKSITFPGKLFYLDLPHNKQTQLLTKAICSLGGVIEGFLSRDINYVVTGNRKAADIANGESSDRKRGPATEKIEKTPYSRGKQLLKKVVQSQECSSILSSARSWGVCVLHVDEVLEYLECSAQRRANRPAEGKGPGGAGQTRKIGKLKSPFLKIEDQSRKYRPIHCSFSNFPECSFISSDRSPFETARTNNSTHKDRDPGEQDKDEGERPQNWEKSGYCECCQKTYTKLGEHMISEQHCRFALNASNYKVIDDITSRIVCDLVPLPNGFKPSEEQREDEAPPQSLEEPTQEENRTGESKEQPVGPGAELPSEEPSLEEQDAAGPIDGRHLALPKDPPLVNLVMDRTQEYAGGLPEKLLVEDGGSQCTESTRNALVPCDLPLVDPCEAGEASHVGLVTEVSWYTEDTGLTSVYTVQSLVIPPAHVLDQPPALAMEQELVQPPLFLSALGDPLHALAQGGLSESSNEPVHGDPITTAPVEPQIINAAPHQTNEPLADEPQITASAGDYAGPSTAPASGCACTLHGLDTAGTGAEVPFVESVVEQSQHVLMVSTPNTPCAVQTELSNSLFVDQSMLAPWHPAADGTIIVQSSTEPLQESQDPEPAVPNTDWGKRKHCWSPCHPPAKRQPLHCQPMPMWVFHQLPSSMNQSAIPVFSDCSARAPAGEGTTPTLCFNPKLAQYEASSGSDWDSQLASQCHNNSPQTAHLGELRTAQVSLDESWYGKQLGSVLAHEQTLGSPSTARTVTLSHASYDIYLSGVAS